MTERTENKPPTAIINNHNTQIYIIRNSSGVSEPKKQSIGFKTIPLDKNISANDISENHESFSSKKGIVSVEQSPQPLLKQKPQNENPSRHVVISSPKTQEQNKLERVKTNDSGNMMMRQSSLKKSPGAHSDKEESFVDTQTAFEHQNSWRETRFRLKNLFKCGKQKASRSENIARTDTIQIIGDRLRRNTTITNLKSRSFRLSTGRILGLIAKVTVKNRDPMTCKIFHEALAKVNPEALEKAKKEFVKKKKGFFKRIYKRIKNGVKRLASPFYPDSKFVIFFKILLTFTILGQCFVATFEVAFPGEDSFHHDMILISLICDLVFAFDITLNFRTSYYHHGELRSDQKDIFFHYFKSYFLLDVITLTSVLSYVFAREYFLTLLCLIRLYQIPRLTATFEDHFQFNRVYSALFKLTKLISFLIMVCHFMACIVYAVTFIDPDPNNWLVYAGLNNSDLIDQYIGAMYWCMTTMATVGYGDIVPRTRIERSMNFCFVILTAIVFGYILSSIGGLLVEISNYTSESREKMRLITKYMNDKGLSKETQNRIRKYLEFYLGKENTTKSETAQIFSFLSENLKDEIIQEVNAKVLDDCYMFSSNFKRKFLIPVSRGFSERSYGPEEMIYNFEDQTDKSIFFIMSGKVDLFYERCDFSIQKLSKGQNFGGYEFFSGASRISSAKSLEFSTVFALSREVFLNCFENFPSEKETFQMISDSINIFNNYQYLNLRCFGCGSKEHLALTCPTLHVRVKKERVIQNYLRDEAEFRQHFDRRLRRRFHVLKNLDTLQEAASQIQLIHQNELSFDENAAFGEEDEEDQYSDGDEILDNNIYDPLPFLYFNEEGEEKEFDPAAEDLKKIRSRNTRGKTLLAHAMTIGPGSEKRKKKRQFDEFDYFIRHNYDPYYRNICIDSIKNFEVYYPNNNFARIKAGLDRKRIENIMQMRIGLKAKHILPLLIKGFKLDQKRNDDQDEKRLTHSMSYYQRRLSRFGERKMSVSHSTIQLPHINVESEDFRSKSKEFEGYPAIALANKRENLDKRRDSLSVPNIRRKGSLSSKEISNLLDTKNNSKNPTLSKFGGRSPNHSPLSPLSPRSEKSNPSDKINSSESSSDGLEMQPSQSTLNKIPTVRGFRTESQKFSIGIKSPMADEYKQDMKFDNYSDNLMKFTNKLEENKSRQTISLQGNFTDFEIKRKIYGQPDLARLILKERNKVLPKKLKRANSLDQIKGVQSILDKLQIEDIIKKYNPRKG